METKRARQGRKSYGAKYGEQEARAVRTHATSQPLDHYLLDFRLVESFLKTCSMFYFPYPIHCAQYTFAQHPVISWPFSIVYELLRVKYESSFHRIITSNFLSFDQEHKGGRYQEESLACRTVQPSMWQWSEIITASGMNEWICAKPNLIPFNSSLFRHIKFKISNHYPRLSEKVKKNQQKSLVIRERERGKKTLTTITKGIWYWKEVAELVVQPFIAEALIDWNSNTFACVCN